MHCLTFIEVNTNAASLPSLLAHLHLKCTHGLTIMSSTQQKSNIGKIFNEVLYDRYN